jgi:hypothetical protein
MLSTAASSPNGVSEHVLRADDVLRDSVISANRGVNVAGAVVI